ncbi:hypothetical protein ABZ319_23650 [Nocardia sp. NPDC005978]|uniref:hypothetical protein n=1 Tax=Nocardia sp. NPDC005978 TaxID=3156725 RepID=UPI0033A7F165
MSTQEQIAFLARAVGATDLCNIVADASIPLFLIAERAGMDEDVLDQILCGLRGIEVGELDDISKVLDFDASSFMDNVARQVRDMIAKDSDPTL